MLKISRGAHLKTRLCVMSSLLTRWYAGRSSRAAYHCAMCGKLGWCRRGKLLMTGRFAPRRSSAGVYTMSAKLNSLRGRERSDACKGLQ